MSVYGGCLTYSRETKPAGLRLGGELSYSMDLTKVRTVPGRSQKGSQLWFINKATLHEHITHPEWGLWKGYNLSKKPQTLLSAPREHKNCLIQKSYRLEFFKSVWHTFGCRCYAILTLDEVRCYEIR